MKRLKAKGVEVIVHEPVLTEPEFYRSRVGNDLPAFRAEADVIVANRVTADLEDVRGKVYTRDVYVGMGEGDPVVMVGSHMSGWKERRQCQHVLKNGYGQYLMRVLRERVS